MANVDLQQIRTVRPATLPLDTKQTLLELHQENLAAGAKSTVATLEEIQSSPATFAVVAAATHTTGLETEIHITAATCAITADAATWPIGATKKIWKLSAYDGNPVTISPPSGATFEGRASISLYGQYSFVEIERISATLFAVRDLEDAFSYIPSVEITSIPGSWNTSLGRCVRKKGVVKILQLYNVTGAVTGTPLYLQSNILPSGLSVLGIYGRPITYQNAGISYGSGIFHGSWAFSSADGTVWNATTPHTWKSGDEIYFELDYLEA